MSESLEKAVAQRKEAIEAVMEMFERGAEVLASAVGQMFPLCEAAAPVLRLALDNVQSREVLYVKDQFVTVRNKLDVLSGQLEDIDCEIKRGRVDWEYFSVEENIRNQFRKYVEILEAKPQFKEVKSRLFTEHFTKTGGEKNLFVLYHALMGTNSFGESVLDVVERYVARSRRLLEDFCVRMKELLCLGLIALLGHCALTLQSAEEEEEKIHEWSRRIQEVESRMKSAIESCVVGFAEQAELDARRHLQAAERADLQAAARQILDSLVKKYDWIYWSVRLVSQSDGAFRDWRAGENFQQVSGRGWFQVEDGVSLVVSYSARPRAVPNAVVLRAMEGVSKRSNAPAVVQQLEKHLDGFVIHAVSRHKEAAAAWNFPPDCHHWEKHRSASVCVHSE